MRNASYRHRLVVLFRNLFSYATSIVEVSCLSVIESTEAVSNHLNLWGLFGIATWGNILVLADFEGSCFDHLFLFDNGD